MRCYLVTTTGAKRYAGTNADAKQTRDAMVIELGVKKKDVEISNAEIPTGKAELLAFVNGLCQELDSKGEE